MPDATFSFKGADQMEAAFRALKRRVNRSASRLLTVLKQEGESYAINYLGHIDTGTTLTSISGIRKGNYAVIVASGAAIWIEFGAGVRKNSGNTHPTPVDSEIPIYSHGGYGKHKGANYDGWYYLSDVPPTTHRNYTKTEDGKYLVHTYGMEQNMFMYHTYEKLVDKLPEYAKKCFREAFNQ